MSTGGVVDLHEGGVRGELVWKFEPGARNRSAEKDHVVGGEGEPVVELDVLAQVEAGAGRSGISHFSASRG